MEWVLLGFVVRRPFVEILLSLQVRSFPTLTAWLDLLVFYRAVLFPDPFREVAAAFLRREFQRPPLTSELVHAFVLELETSRGPHYSVEFPDARLIDRSNRGGDLQHLKIQKPGPPHPFLEERVRERARELGCRLFGMKWHPPSLQSKLLMLPLLQ